MSCKVTPVHNMYSVIDMETAVTVLATCTSQIQPAENGATMPSTSCCSCLRATVLATSLIPPADDGVTTLSAQWSL